MTSTSMRIGKALLILSVALPAASGAEPAVRVAETTILDGIDCFRVETPTATYLYGKRGAGFASLIDKDGHDWISYHPGDKSRGEFRGLPKCGQPEKLFHCGYGYGQYPTKNPFLSHLVVFGDDHVRIDSETLDGSSACSWDFYPDHATLTLHKIALPTYWFLYEGAPGGRLDPKEDFVLRPDGTRTDLDTPWSGVVPWVCFGAKETPTGLLLVNHQPPEPGETDSYVSWPFKKEEDGSFQEMTVFGFGRKGYRELVEHVPDLKGLPARFSLAFVEKADPPTARAAAGRLGLLAAAPAQVPGLPKSYAERRDYARWEKEVAAYEEADRKSPPPKGGALFIGSSTVRLWKTLAEDFPENKVVNRGFGGTEIVDSTHFADRLIFPHEPKQIFLRAGGNDIHAGRTPKEVAADFAEFVRVVHSRLPQAEILYIALSPAPARWGEGDKTRELNRLVRQMALEMPRVGYVDAYDLSLTPDGRARPELFVKDRLHFSPEGYKLLAERVRPFLVP